MDIKVTVCVRMLTSRKLTSHQFNAITCIAVGGTAIRFVFTNVSESEGTQVYLPLPSA
jgi:hypothetical protein